MDLVEPLNGANVLQHPVDSLPANIAASRSYQSLEEFVSPEWMRDHFHGDLDDHLYHIRCFPEVAKINALFCKSDCPKVEHC